MKQFKLMFLFVFVAMLMAACTGGGSGELEVNGVWGRTSPKAAANGAFYMNVVNNTNEDDTLLSATSEACGVVELHEMYMKENDVMGMRPVPGGTIPVAAGETVELKVGGLHVMCLDKQVEFTVGDEIPVTLTFENAGEMEVTAEIQDTAEGNMNMDMEQDDEMKMEGDE